jgi:L-amino acid N-acyltransferase YncA
LTDQEGFLMVATWEDTPVAIARAAFYTPGEAWLEGMRVDPEHRRRGISSSLFAALMEELGQRGIGVARLSTSRDNVPIQRMCDHMGFHRVMRVRGRSRPLQVAPPPPSLRPLNPDEMSVAEVLLARRGIAARGTPSFLETASGLYALRGGLWVSWDEERLREHIAQGHVWVWEAAGRPRAIAVVTPHRRRTGFYQIGLLEGPAAACTALLDALALRETVSVEDPERPPLIRAYIPLELDRLHRAAASAGYRFSRGWHGEMWLYEWVAP